MFGCFGDCGCTVFRYNHCYRVFVISVSSHLRQEIELVARSDFTVLVLGETGVGKELVVRAIHAASQRKDNPILYLNCAAFPETLADSELFGHTKGAFTSATRDRAGKFEIADGGTLEVLNQYSWSGNVRELENVLSRAILKASTEYSKGETLVIESAHLSSDVSSGSTPLPSPLSEMTSSLPDKLSFRKAHMIFNEISSCAPLQIETAIGQPPRKI